MVEEIERVYTIPLRDAYNTVRGKRSSRAVKILKSFLARHMKTEEGRVKVSAEVNSFIWARGIKKPPRKVKVKAKRDAKGEVSVSLIEEPKEKPAEGGEGKKG